MKYRLFPLLVSLFLLLSANVNAETIKKFTKGMTFHQGYVDFYYQQDTGKVFLVVDKLNQQMLMQTSLPQGLGSNDIGLDRGQLGDTRLVKFEKHGNKVFLTHVNSYYRASSNNKAERDSVNEAFAKSIIQGFTVVAGVGDKVLIDYTNYLLSDVHGVSDTLKSTKQGSYRADASRSAVYTPRSKAFPNNTELEAIVTFTGSNAGKYVKQIAPDNKALTVHLHHSFIKLPDNNYQPRLFHPASGYWSISHQNYAAGLDEPMTVKYIPRHRLAKKDPSAATSEAVEPIVYYLDPGTPEPVRTALLDGARWWNDAFTAAGYINAFQVKMLPEDADPMDVRYNTIQWVHRATRGWSYGASVIDPRTGEIIKGHVTLGSLRVRQDYLIAQGLTGPFSTNGADTTAIKEMALARIRQLSAHEVGHTLGIAHNFAASANNRASVMDYPHPLVEVIQGKIDLSNAYAEGIGTWDTQVVKYGYSDFAPNTSHQVQLSQILQHNQKLGLQFISDADARPLSGAHPDAHLWDNGEDAVAELKRVLDVRHLALSQFGLNNLALGRDVSDLQEILMPIYFFHRYQVEAALKTIAGVNYNYHVKGESTSLTSVGKKQQQQALKVLLSTLSPSTLTLPKHISQIIPPKAYGSYRNRESAKGNTGLVFDPLSLANAAAGHTLKGLFNSARLNRLSVQQAYQQDALTLGNYLTVISAATVQAELDKGAKGVVQQRVAAMTLDHMMQALTSDNTSIEVKATIHEHITEVYDWLQGWSQDAGLYKIMQQQLAIYFNQGTWKPLTKATPMPPGSPI